MATKLMLVKGMTCSACERQVVDALVKTGAREVHADSQRGEVLLDHGDASEGRLRDAVELIGYHAAAFQSLPSEPVARPQAGSDKWTALLVLPAICCGLPLLLTAAATLGFGTWFAAHRLLLLSALAFITAGVLVVLGLRRRRAAPR